MITIKPALMSEAATLLELQKLAYQSEAALYNDYEIKPLTQTLESARADFQEQIILKAECNDQIVGSVRGHLINGACRIGRLFVHPGFQHRGIGAQLMQAIERHFVHAE